MAKVLLEQEYSVYESPKIDVVELSTLDIVCGSPEGGDEYNNDWM